MTRERSRKQVRRGAAVAAAAAGLVASVVTTPAAQAAPAAGTGINGMVDAVQQAATQSLMSSTGVDLQGALAHLRTQATSLTEGNKLLDALGTRAADFFLNPNDGTATVNVLDNRAAEQVRGAGLTAKLVKHSSAELDAVKAKFDAMDSTDDTAWGIDPATNKVVVTISDAAPKAEAAKLAEYARSFGDKVRIERQAQGFKQHILGGSEITDGTVTCSAGFNATNGKQKFVVTAGHCTEGMPNWQGLGPSVRSNFPRNDFGLIRNTSGNAPGAVTLYGQGTQKITRAAMPTVGQQACKSGRTSQITCGEVEALDQTVDYGPDSIVSGLVQTSVQSEPGDSGGPLFDGQTGLGLVSGGNDITTFYQPVTEALNTYGLRLVPGSGGGGSVTPPREPEAPPAPEEPESPIGGLLGIRIPIIGGFL